jgi:hypothetical protein
MKILYESVPLVTAHANIKNVWLPSLMDCFAGVASELDHLVRPTVTRGRSLESKISRNGTKVTVGKLQDSVATSLPTAEAMTRVPPMSSGKRLSKLRNLVV